MQQQDPHNDRKLLIGVASAVVAGVAAIALIAGLNERGADETVASNGTHRSPTATTARPEALPARETGGRVAPETIDDFLTKVSDAMPAPPEAAKARETAAEGAGATAVPAFQIDPDADLEAEGRKAFARGAYDEAAAWFVAATDDDPDDAMAHYLLGLSRWKAGDLPHAATSLERSGELNPISIRTWINLSRVRNELDDFSAALAAAQTALDLDPEDPTALYLEGRSLRNLGRVDDAIASLEKSFELDSENGQVANLLGLIAIERGEVETAARRLTRAADLAPEVAYIRNNLGVALERSGRPDEAIAQFRRTLELEPGHAKAEASIARLEPLVDGSGAPGPRTTAIAEGTLPVRETAPVEAVEPAEPAESAAPDEADEAGTDV